MYHNQSQLEKVILYIEEHLSEPMNLKLLADLGNTSYYHFNHVFSETQGEPIWQFVKRLRLERAAYLLQYAGLSVADIAEAIGYASNASFSKAFEQHFQQSPTRFRSLPRPSVKADPGNDILNYTAPRLTIEPDQQMLFVRKAGLLRHQEAWQHLMEILEYPAPKSFFTEEGLSNPGFIGKSPDVPGITVEANLRYDVGLTVKPGIKLTGKEAMGQAIQWQTLPGGKYAVLLHQGSTDALAASFQAIYSDWLPKSGYRLRNAPSYQKYLPLPNNSEWATTSITQIYIPIQ
ncbi:MAG: GyrI-like domain-containing protein [Bacteroidota bacterium]